MTIKDQIQNYANVMGQSLDGCISATVFDVQKMEALAYYSPIYPKFDDRVVAHISQAVQDSYQGLSLLHGMQGKLMKSMEIDLENQTHLLIFTPHRRVVCYIVLEAGKSNLALAEILHQKYYTESLLTVRDLVMAGKITTADPLFSILPMQQ